MAFIRSYSAQGDPRGRRTTMRAGRLYHTKLVSLMRARRGNARRRMLALHAGDPFSLRMPKFIRKLSLKKIGSALKPLAQFALPLAGAINPALAPLAALGSAALSGGGRGSQPAPELTMQPTPSGPPAAVSMGYTVPGVEVTSSGVTRPYSVFERRNPPPDDEDEYDEEDDVADVGDEEEE